MTKTKKEKLKTRQKLIVGWKDHCRRWFAPNDMRQAGVDFLQEVDLAEAQKLTNAQTAEAAKQRLVATRMRDMPGWGGW